MIAWVANSFALPRLMVLIVALLGLLLLQGDVSADSSCGMHSHNGVGIDCDRSPAYTSEWFGAATTANTDYEIIDWINAQARGLENCYGAPGGGYFEENTSYDTWITGVGGTEDLLPGPCYQGATLYFWGFFDWSTAHRHQLSESAPHPNIL